MADFLFYLSISCFVVAIFAYIMDLLKIPFPSFQKSYIINTSYIELCKQIIYYTTNDLNRLGIKYYPELEIKYTQNKKMHAKYESNSQKVVIYLKNHHNANKQLDVIEVVDSILHETRHFQQHKSMKNYNDIINYDKYGYINAPGEIDARNYAKENSPKCIQFLYEKKIIGLNSLITL